MSNWKSYPKQAPTEEKRYLVTRQIINKSKTVDICWWANNLYKKDPSDFYRDQDRPGWYDSNSECGRYEVDGVIAWMELPEVYFQELEKI